MRIFILKIIYAQQQFFCYTFGSLKLAQEKFMEELETYNSSLENRQYFAVANQELTLAADKDYSIELKIEETRLHLPQ